VHLYQENKQESGEFFHWDHKILAGSMPGNLPFHRPFPIVAQHAGSQGIICYAGMKGDIYGKTIS
jgi:hypothetical protein